MKTGIRAALPPGYRQGLKCDVGQQDSLAGPLPSYTEAEFQVIEAILWAGLFPSNAHVDFNYFK
jgi:hypothetical protein